MADHLQVPQEHHHHLDLPPGFRFHPTDMEIITFYLVRKVLKKPFHTMVIEEVDLNKCEPWDLPKKVNMGDAAQYFFSHKDLKYPTGVRTNRATNAGYWKATGKDKEIFHPPTMSLIGMKKTLVFYKGRAPRGEKTNWIMHEYRLQTSKKPAPGLPTDIARAANINASSKEEYVVCRILHKSTGLNTVGMPSYAMSMGVEKQHSFFESNTFAPLMDYDTSSLLDPLPPLSEASLYEMHNIGVGSSTMSSVVLPTMNNHYFENHHQQMMVAPPQSSISFYNNNQQQQMIHMSANHGFMVEVDPRSGTSSIVSQEDVVTGVNNNIQGNGGATTSSEISSVNMGMDGMWNY